MFPQLETSRLLLAELVHTDAHGVFDVFSNERVVEFYDMPAFTTIAEAERLIQRMRDRAVMLSYSSYSRMSQVSPSRSL
jgi:hypothetical protein